MLREDIDELIADILAKDARYERDAYRFVLECIASVREEDPLPKRRDFKAWELLDLFRDRALRLYGPMAMDVLGAWGVRSCRDFGRIIFNLVGAGLLGKSKDDKLEDFDQGYDFREAFRAPFLPRSKRP